jgi:hypothetical protein
MPKTTTTRPASADEAQLLSDMLTVHRRAGAVAAWSLLSGMVDASDEGATRTDHRRAARAAAGDFPVAH